MNLWTYRKRFKAAGVAGEVVVRSSLKGLDSTLTLEGGAVDRDFTPISGVEAVRNHRLATTLADGRRLDVEAGYVSWVDLGIAVRVDGTLVHQSHPNRTIAFPRSARGMTEQTVDLGAHWKKNGPALVTDIALGLLFFAVGKLFDLSTAALVAAAAGLALIVVQRFVRVDLLGGLALFGVATLLLSAGYALAFQDEEAVKLRTTVVGLIVAVVFISDGLLGGRWLGRGLARYLPYEGLHLGRLSLGMGVTGAVMAGLNLVVVRTVPTDVWLFYTTFGDVTVAMLLFFAVLKFARPAQAAA